MTSHEVTHMNKDSSLRNLEVLIPYKMLINQVSPFNGLEYWTELFSIFGQLSAFVLKKPIFFLKFLYK